MAVPLSFLPAVFKFSSLPISSPTLGVVTLLDNRHSSGFVVLFHWGFNLHFTDDRDVGHLLMYSLTIQICSSMKCQTFCLSKKIDWLLSIGLYAFFIYPRIFHVTFKIILWERVDFLKSCFIINGYSYTVGNSIFIVIIYIEGINISHHCLSF